MDKPSFIITVIFSMIAFILNAAFFNSNSNLNAFILFFSLFFGALLAYKLEEFDNK